MNNKQNVTDIHSYTVFANIDNRKGTIQGHQIYLSKEQMEAIEDIVLSGDVKVAENSSYEVE